MKLIKTASGDKLKISKKEWESIGKTAGWDDNTSQAIGWDKFNDLVDLGTWDEVVETGWGEPTSDESRAIERLGYYGKSITQESIEGLKKGEPYKEGLKITSSGPEGSSTVEFASKEEMKQYIVERFGGDLRDLTEESYGDDYTNNYLEGATMSELGIDIKDPFGKNKTKTEAPSIQPWWDEAQILNFQEEQEAREQESHPRNHDGN